MNKTAHHFDWENGYYKRKTLTRSFSTLDEAKKFAEGKQVKDIFKSKGRYVVEWEKLTIMNN